MYFRDAKHFQSEAKRSLEKGMKAGVAEANKKSKLEIKNEQRKQALARRIKSKDF